MGWSDGPASGRLGVRIRAATDLSRKILEWDDKPQTKRKRMA